MTVLVMKGKKSDIIFNNKIPTDAINEINPMLKTLLYSKNLKHKKVIIIIFLERKFVLSTLA